MSFSEDLEGPKFVQLFDPVLVALRTLGGSARPAEVVEQVADALRITDEELSDPLPSGTSRFTNLVTWARFYLAKAGYIDSSKRGVWTLTEKGIQAKLMSRTQRQLASGLMVIPVIFSFGCDPCTETRADVLAAQQCPEHCGTTCVPIPTSDQTCGDALRSCLAQISAHNALPCAAGHCKDPQECLDIPLFLGPPGVPPAQEQQFMNDQDCLARCWQCEEGNDSPEPGCQCHE